MALRRNDNIRSVLPHPGFYDPAQSGTASMEQDSLIADTDPEHLTCLCARETFDVTQHHDLTLAFGELIDRRSQDRRPCGRIEPGFGLLRPRCERICPLSLGVKSRRVHG